MAEDRNKPTPPSTFERGAQVPSQPKVPAMPAVKPPATTTSTSSNKK